MLTIFTTAKAFTGHSAVIQRNALKSWTLLHPGVEVILFGDEEGATETAREMGIRHEPHVERNEIGLKRIDYYFGRAQQIARHEVLCYVNCDIVLTNDLADAVERVRAAHKKFLMVGRRWDVDIKEPINFFEPNWAEAIRRRAALANDQRDHSWIDYFVFSRGLYLGKIPPLIVGRLIWDNFLIWRALSLGAPVVDASAIIRAVHQNHDYAYHPLGKQGVWNDEQTQRNLQYAGGPSHMRTIADASFVLRSSGLKPNRRRHWETVKRAGRLTGRFMRFKVWNPAWFALLTVTRPIRKVLGLRAEAISRARGKA